MSSATPTHDYTARARLFGGNRMKLGVMAFNCSHGSTITTVPDRRDDAVARGRRGGGLEVFRQCIGSRLRWRALLCSR
jgi:hypothetical protein